MKTTPLTLLPKPEFVANVDTANEEIVRLVGQYNALVSPEGRLTKAENDLDAANALLSTAIKPEDLQTAKDATEAANKEVTRLIAENKTLGEKADKAGAGAVAAIASSGVTDPAKVKGANDAEADKPNTDGLTGLARACAANIAMQAKK